MKSEIVVILPFKKDSESLSRGTEDINDNSVLNLCDLLYKGFRIKFPPTIFGSGLFVVLEVPNREQGVAINVRL
ncbi:MAG: hypothetical protein WC306_03370 [Candidatus Paceibacterota bacterium]|jgi:hypothetical protein